MKRAILLCLLGSLLPFSARGADPELTAEVQAGLSKAVKFFRTQVAVEGGCLWRYRADLERGEGERQAGKRTVWIQPPGTPSVGLAYLEVFRLTGDRAYLDAARETANGLARGQLRSGGWDYLIEFEPDARKRYAYRLDPPREGKLRNTTTLDDNTTQESLRCLMQVDQALEFKDPTIHDAAEYALAALLKAQYPNGAWPQRYSEFPDPEKFPVRRASYPESWSREYEGDKYYTHYTLNDNTLADTIDTMLLAADIYNDAKYRQAALRGGEFILLAQLPEPQPAWAQQYDSEMHPAWARKFEPPSVTGGESQGIMQLLLELYRRTGERKFLDPVPRALAYLKKSQLADGRLARFYELKTNRPLYFTRQYELTYDDGDLPTHYGFKVSSKLDRIARDYERLKDADPAELAKPRTPGRIKMSTGLAREAREVLDAMDDRGVWVEQGELRAYDDDNAREIIDVKTYSQRIVTLARYLSAARSE